MKLRRTIKKNFRKLLRSDAKETEILLRYLRRKEWQESRRLQHEQI